MSLSIGVIGMGNRLQGVLSTLNSLDLDVKVSCIADPDPAALDRLAASGIPHEGVRYYKDADELLEKETPDGMMVGTRCNLHAQMAVKVIEKGLPMFLEKPVFMDEDGYRMLKEAKKKQKAPIVVSFPLRLTALAQAAKEVIDQGTLGPIAQVAAINTVNYARGYFKKWYRDGSITGGMFLQKATHDLDLIFYLTGAKPLQLCAMESKAVMGGDMPAGISCPDCEKRYTCPESDWSLEHQSYEPAQPLTCSFGSDVTITDASSTLIMLDNGAHASYAQCFVARKQAGRRCTRIVGYKATLELDFPSSKVTVYHHGVNRVDEYKIGEMPGHSGGDAGLMKAFVKLMKGENCEHPDLEDGIISALTCLRAEQSADQQKFMDCRQ